MNSSSVIGAGRMNGGILGYEVLSLNMKLCTVI